jgi:hypothetical protein
MPMTYAAAVEVTPIAPSKRYQTRHLLLVQSPVHNDLPSHSADTVVTPTPGQVITGDAFDQLYRQFKD